MKHALLGVGAIGGLLGTALAVVNENVTLIVRPDTLARYPKELQLEQPAGTFTAPAHPVSTLTEPVDVLWIATKTYQLESALESVQTMPHTVVPLLNGVDHVPVLRARFGHDRVVPATIAVEAERSANGRFVQRTPVRLNLAASGEALLADVIARLQERVGFLCRFVPNEQTLLWGKLCFLAPFALATSASGKDKGAILADPEWKNALYSAIEEATSVARAEGAEVDAAAIENLLQTMPATMRSSMAKDLAAGRELELDGIAGPIVRGGEQHRIPVPTTRRLIEMITAEVARAKELAS